MREQTRFQFILLMKEDILCVYFLKRDVEPIVLYVVYVTHMGESSEIIDSYRVSFFKRLETSHPLYSGAYSIKLSNS